MPRTLIVRTSVLLGTRFDSLEIVLFFCRSFGKHDEIGNRNCSPLTACKRFSATERSVYLVDPSRLRRMNNSVPPNVSFVIGGRPQGFLPESLFKIVFSNILGYEIQSGLFGRSKFLIQKRSFEYEKIRHPAGSLERAKNRENPLRLGQRMPRLFGKFSEMRSSIKQLRFVEHCEQIH